jgi:general secretion pathway protein L
MITAFFTWWLRQIQTLAARLPGRAGAPDAMIVAIDDVLAPAGSIFIRRKGKEVATAGLDFTARQAALPPTLPVGLRLPDGMVLQRDVTLPLAAAHDLQAVIGFEIDRLTPFAPDEVFWSTAGLRRNPARGELGFSLLLVLRQPVERLATALNRIGLRPSFIESGAGRIALGRARRPDGLRHFAIYALCAALVAACLITPIIRQQLALADAARQLAALAPARDEAMRLHQRLAVAASGQAAITAARQSVDMLAALASLTNALPDDTSLTDLTLNAGALTIDGESGNAARLIGVLAATPGISGPAFAAPVTRAIDGGSDLFSIRATISP